MLKKASLIAAITMAGIAVFAQQPEKPTFSSQFSGFIKNDFFFDTHENVTIREGHFLLYPANNVMDATGEIINDKLNFNFLSIQSRLTWKISGPDAFGAKTSGVVEADFFGNENQNFADLNGLRLRHAFVKLNWKNTELLTGQFWHPLFVPDCFPGVVSFNTGSPFQPFSRNPQIRITHALNKFRIIGALNSQRDFTNIGGPNELRNAALPDLNAQVHYTSRNETSGKSMISGIGIEYKKVTPRLSNKVGNLEYAVDESVGSMALMAFGKFQSRLISLKAQAIYGQNLTDLVMMGGYLTHEITDTTTGERTYTPLNNFSAWFEAQNNTGPHEFGLFAGYSQNLGADKKYLNSEAPTKTRGLNIHHVYRLSPRYVITAGKLKIAAELEYTVAAYSTKDQNGAYNIDEKGKVTDYELVTNTRLLASVIYHF
jgi:hypothetical protein